jgi:hypothetical protein
MWPWEHLAVAYLLASAVCRLGWREPPGDRAAALVAVAALLPDLVDKPLAWWLGALPAGATLAHSLFTFLPLAALALAAGARYRRLPEAVAFSVAYASHLAGDVAYPLAVRGELRAEFLFWPLVPVAGGTTSVLPHVRDLFAVFFAFLSTPRGVAYLALDAALVTGAVALWVADGAPGLPAALRPGRSSTAGEP